MDRMGGGNVRCGYESSDCRASTDRSRTCIHPLQKFPYGPDRPGIGGDISRQRRDGFVKFAAFHDVEHALHRLRFQEIAFADEEIVFRQHPDEIEPELPRRCLDAETCVRHAAGDVSGDGGMGKFHLLRAVDFGFVDLVQGEQLVEQQPRSRIVIAIDKASLAIDEVLQGRDLERVAVLDYQAHLARDETDHAVFARIKPLLASMDTLGAQFAVRQMHPREVAGSLRQGYQRILIADVAQIDADTGFTVEQLPQLRDSETVTGVNADYRRAMMQKWLDFGDQLLRQVFQLWTETRLHALSRPHQLFSEGRQFRALAAMGFDQWHPEKIGPLLDEIPDVAVRKLGVLGRAGEFSGFSDLVEDPEHHDRRLRAAFLVKSPDGLDFNMQHWVHQGYEVYFIYLRAIGSSYHIYERKYPPMLKNKKRRKYDVDCI